MAWPLCAAIALLTVMSVYRVDELLSGEALGVFGLTFASLYGAVRVYQLFMPEQSPEKVKTR